jgi:hypothetical protein
MRLNICISQEGIFGRLCAKDYFRVEEMQMLHAIFMTRFLTLIIGLLFSLTIYGQDTNLGRNLSLQDSILLNNFWTIFKKAVNANDKAKIATLCKFPFYCRPCIDDTTLKDNNHVTIKVTKSLYNDSQYKIFLDKHIKNEVNKHVKFDTYIFIPTFDDRNRIEKIGFKFSYTIVAPSKNWEGLQGFIFLGKIDGKYKITGIDTVP